MRPTHVINVVIGVLVALAGLVVVVLAFVDDQGRPWHYWLAPVLALSFVLLLIAVAVGYYVQVIRPDMKGRPRGE